MADRHRSADGRWWSWRSWTIQQLRGRPELRTQSRSGRIPTDASTCSLSAWWAGMLGVILATCPKMASRRLLMLSITGRRPVRAATSSLLYGWATTLDRLAAVVDTCWQTIHVHGLLQRSRFRTSTDHEGRLSNQWILSIEIIRWFSYGASDGNGVSTWPLGRRNQSPFFCGPLLPPSRLHRLNTWSTLGMHPLFRHPLFGHPLFRHLCLLRILANYTHENISISQTSNVVRIWRRLLPRH